MRYHEASSTIASGPKAVWRSMPDLGPSFGRFARGLKRGAGAGH